MASDAGFSCSVVCVPSEVGMGPTDTRAQVTDAGFVSDNVNDLFELPLDTRKKNLVIIDEFPKADIAKNTDVVKSRKENSCSIIFTCQSERLWDLPEVVRNNATYVFAMEDYNLNQS